MIDPFGRDITYLRVSVTDRCNLRCRYCMPPTGVVPMEHIDILRYEEIAAFVGVAVELGITKVRLTGGEPLIRKNILHLVKTLAGTTGLDTLAMTTNATALAELARPLREAGLQRINVSLDAIDPERYRAITRGGDVTKALAGLAAAKEAGFEPIKINCVIAASRDEPDAVAVRRYAEAHGFLIRYIREMDIGAGTFHIVDGGSGGDCKTCNRLRLSADGYLRPCLFSDRKVLIRGADHRGAIEKALAIKPEFGTGSTENQMHCIGG